MRPKEALFYLRHPKEAFVTYAHQVKVAFELEMPPSGSTIERFPELPLREAALLIASGKKEKH